MLQSFVVPLKSGFIMDAALHGAGARGVWHVPVARRAEDVDGMRTWNACVPSLCGTGALA